MGERLRKLPPSLREGRMKFTREATKIPEMEGWSQYYIDNDGILAYKGKNGIVLARIGSSGNPRSKRLFTWMDIGNNPVFSGVDLLSMEEKAEKILEDLQEVLGEIRKLKRMGYQ